MREGLRDRDLYTSLVILARYYYHVFGYRKKKISDLLLDFLKRNYPRYELDETYWLETLEKISSRAGKYQLAEIEGVKVSVAEMQVIQSIHNKVLERLAFTMLVVAKFWNMKKPENDGWVNTSSKDLFKYARITSNTIDRELRIGELHDLGLVEFPKRNGNLNCRITFIHDDSEEAVFVDDFREIGYAYLKYNGENYIKCAECGILIRNNKYGNKKYCKDCSTYTPQVTKTITCIDCGKDIILDSKNNRSHRCSDCQAKYRKDYQKNLMRNRRC